MMWWAGGAYLGTALVGVWAAYDRQVAWGRFGLLAVGVAGALSIARYGSRGGERALGNVTLALALVGAAISVHFLLSSTWTAPDPAKVSALRQVGAWIEAIRPVELSGGIHRNAVGGALAIVLPAVVAGMGWHWTCRRRAVALMAAGAALLASAALLLTVSRGAWLGLAAGALFAGYLGARRGLSACRSGPLHTALFWLERAVLGVVVLLPLLSFWMALALPSLAGAPPEPGGSVGESLASRAQLWRNVSAMIRDCAFTGSGLGATEMVYSSYVVLLHVPYLSHAHNLYLETAIEQGVPGLLAFVGLTWLRLGALTNCWTGSVPMLRFRAAAVAGTVALLVHGMVDAQLYASPLVPVMLLAYGFALPNASVRDTHGAANGRPHACRRVLIPGLGALVALTVLLQPGSRAAVQANVGAVAQARSELSVYHWPAWPVQDAVRRTSSVDLGPAVASFRAALELDPDNVTANRRLGQIELSLGQYEAARRHLERAHAAAPHERATRQLLGESYALDGESERAAAIWRTLDIGQGQLDVRRGWYDLLDDRDRSALVVRAMTLVHRAAVQPPA